MRLSNELVYNGALKCGVESVADAKLCLTNSQALHDVSNIQYMNGNHLCYKLRIQVYAVFLSTNAVTILS